MDEKRLEIIRARVERAGERLGGNSLFSWYEKDVDELLGYIERLEDKINVLEDYSGSLEDEIQAMKAE